MRLARQWTGEVFALCAALTVVWAASAPAAPADKTIRGTVVDARGEPVADAEIWLTCSDGRQDPEKLDSVAASQSDAQGRFSATVPDDWTAGSSGPSRRPVALFVYKLGMRLFGSHIPSALPGFELRVKLQPANEVCHWKLQAPDQKPLAGARVALAAVYGEPFENLLRPGLAEVTTHAAVELKARSMISEMYPAPIWIPPALGDRLAVESDAQGDVAWKETNNGQTAAVHIDSEPFGRQQACLPRNIYVGYSSRHENWPNAVTLSPIGRLSGRLVADQPGASAGWSVRVRSWRGGGADEPINSSCVEVTTDAEGKFEIPRLAEGIVWFQVTPPEGSKLRADLPQPPPTLAPDKPCHVEIRLVPAADQQESVGMVGPGQPMSAVACHVVHGSVVDEEAKPVAGAKVAAFGYFELPANMRDHPPINFLVVDLSTTCDAQGQFTLEGLRPHQQLCLEARTADAVTESALVVPSETSEPVALRISRGNSVFAEGRLLDPAGAPIADGEVEIWVRPWMPPPFACTPRRVDFTGVASLRTDAEGRFRTPRVLQRGLEYRAIATGSRLQRTESAWIAPGPEEHSSFPDLVVARMAGLAGRVCDRQGRPLQGATVWASNRREQSRPVQTDAEGRFELQTAIQPSSLLFVEKRGFRFFGRPLGSEKGDLEVVLTAVTEEPEQAMHSLPLLPKPERLALVRRLLEHDADQLAAGSDMSEAVGVMRVFSRIDPVGSLQRFQGQFSKGYYYFGIQNALLRGLWQERPDEVQPFVESLDAPEHKATSYIALCEMLPDAERQRKQDLLAEALLSARRLRGDMQIAVIADIADRLLDLGDLPSAKQLLEEYRPQVEQLPATKLSGYVRGAFAKALARVDLPKALELVANLNDAQEFDRHHGNVAVRLACVQPADAQRVLGIIGEAFQKNLYSVQVCYRMAPIDRARAEQIAEAIISLETKARALGAMAQALATSQPKEAAQLLEKVRAILEPPADEPHSAELLQRVPVICSLLPIAEQIDPRLVPEILWRAASWRRPRGESAATVGTYGSTLGQIDCSNALLAMALARYDRSLGRLMYDPFANPQQTLLLGRQGGFLPAAMLIDPAEAVALVEKATGPDADQLKIRLAFLLCLDDEELGQTMDDSELRVPSAKGRE